MITVDLHGREVCDAELEIIAKLYECVAIEDFELEIVHGFNHGTAIKDYIKSPRFKQVIQAEGFLVERISATKGSVQFRVHSNIDLARHSAQQTSKPPKSERIGTTCQYCGKPTRECSCRFCATCGELLVDGRCGCDQKENYNE